MNPQPPYLPTGLDGAIRRWIRQNQNWCLRMETASDNQPASYFYATPSYYRHAAADEVAAEIVSSPALRETLGLLASPPGQAIEGAVARLWLPGWQATLLTDALTLAWKTVLDQNRPVWQRIEVLAVVALLGFVCLALWVSRD
jgi:hypothetical protein